MAGKRQGKCQIKKSYVYMVEHGVTLILLRYIDRIEGV